MSVPATYQEPKGLFAARGDGERRARRAAAREARFPEIVEKTGGGVIVDADDPEALADGFLALLARSGARRRRSARAGAAGVRAHYSVEIMADSGEAVYRELAAQAWQLGLTSRADAEPRSKSYPTPRGPLPDSRGTSR